MDRGKDLGLLIAKKEKLELLISFVCTLTAALEAAVAVKAAEDKAKKLAEDVRFSENKIGAIEVAHNAANRATDLSKAALSAWGDSLNEFYKLSPAQISPEILYYIRATKACATAAATSALTSQNYVNDAVIAVEQQEVDMSFALLVAKLCGLDFGK